MNRPIAVMPLSVPRTPMAGSCHAASYVRCRERVRLSRENSVTTTPTMVIEPVAPGGRSNSVRMACAEAPVTWNRVASRSASAVGPCREAAAATTISSGMRVVNAWPPITSARSRPLIAPKRRRQRTGSDDSARDNKIRAALRVPVRISRL